jgi:arylsulfatase A-like enzyme
MTMKATAALPLFMMASVLSPLSASQPDIIWILADDLGYADVGFNGLTDYETPQIDRLAEDGIIFPNGYSTHPFCGPARAALMSGRYQQRFEFYGNPQPPRSKQYDPDFGIPMEEETIAEVLKDEGYRTGIIGKWHLGHEKEFHPLNNGFTDFFGFLGGHSSFYKTDIDWVSLTGKGKWIKNPPARSSRTLYMTDLFSDEAIEFVRSTDRDQPYFLYLAYNAPHTPMHATQDWLDKVDDIEDPMRRIYAAMVSAMDDGIGRLITELKRSGRYENTLIFFMSDNGGIVPFGGNNGPLRGMKGNLVEGGIRVPFSVTWKNQLAAGEVFEEPVISLDAYATSIAAAGAEVPPEADGLDLVPALKGAGNLERVGLFWKTGSAQQWAVRAGEHKLLHVAGLDKRLFNLDSDIGEQTPLAPDERLQGLYRAWADTLPPDERVAKVANFKWAEQASGVGMEPSPADVKRARDRDARNGNLIKKALPPK